MSKISEISKQISKRKDLEMNLPKYCGEMFHLYNDFSMIKFAMNYYTLSEVMDELADKPSYACDIYDNVNGIVKDGLLSYDVSKSEELVTRLGVVRDDIIKHMEIITAYVDRFRVFEYILNRIEYRFNDEECDNNYYENLFTNDIMHYIISDKESVNVRIQEIMEQLPVRMTKSKFFERIKETFTLYKDSEQTAFNDFIYTIRTVSMLYKPEGFETEYTDLYEMYESFTGVDYKNVSDKEFKVLRDKLQLVVEKLLNYSDIFASLQEIVNDLLIVLLARPYDMNDSKYLTGAVEKINVFATKEVQDFDIDYITEEFMKIEGVQEDLYMEIFSHDYVIDEFSKDDILGSLMLEKQFASLRMISRLSAGLFLKLEEAKESAIATQEYIDEIFEKLIGEFETLFGSSSLYIKRAVMANVIGQLPNFFQNIDELQAYVNVSLSQCNDEAERYACMKLIGQIINSDD